MGQVTAYDEEGNRIGFGVIIGLLVLLWVLRALFSAADQSK